VDIDFLRTFLEVNKTRHFGKAAKQLFVTPSAISSRIRLLEDSVGTRLFSRDRNDIQLTTAGKNLVQMAETIVSLWDETKANLTDSEEQKTLFIGSVSSLWDMLLSEWLPLLRSRMDYLMIKGESLGVSGQVHALLSKTIDLGFMFEPPKIAELKPVKIMDVELVLVSTQPNLSVVTALGDNYIFVEWGTSFLVDHARTFPDVSLPKVHLDLGRWAVDYLLNTRGTAYLAKNMVQDFLDQKRLFLVEDAPIFHREAYAVYRQKSKNLPQILESLDLLQEMKNPSGEEH